MYYSVLFYFIHRLLGLDVRSMPHMTSFWEGGSDNKKDHAADKPIEMSFVLL